MAQTTGIAIGENATASAVNSIAIGDNTTAAAGHVALNTFDTMDAQGNIIPARLGAVTGGLSFMSGWESTASIAAAYNSLLAAMGKGGTPPSSPYVSNGLQCHLDGVYNRGVGLHDDLAKVWTDLSGGGHDASVNSAVSFGVMSLLNSSYVIPAVIDGLNADVDFNSACTIELVVSRSPHAERMVIFGNYNFNSLKGYSIELFYGNGTNYNVRFYLSPHEGVADSFDTGINLGERVKKHLAFTRNGGSLSFYENGVLKKTETTTISVPVADPWRIGCDATRPNFAFWGAFFAIRVYSRALSAQEIASNFSVDSQRFGIQ